MVALETDKIRSISVQYSEQESMRLWRFSYPHLWWVHHKFVLVYHCIGLHCSYYLFFPLLCLYVTMFRSSHTTASRIPAVLWVAVSILEGPLLMLGVGWGRGGRRVRRRASLDQYSTHIASAGWGWWGEQHLKLREKDGALGRATDKRVEAISLLCLIFTHLPLF
jgi:hypothetical protein